MNERENTLRAYTFRGPERIPMFFRFNPACLRAYPVEELDRMVRRHESLFPQLREGWTVRDLAAPPWARVGQPYTDPWGCVWETAEEGLMGIVTRHPLTDWAVFDSFRAPDPERCNGLCEVDWSALERQWARAKEEGTLRQGGVPHGFFFLMLTYLRGFENLMIDMAEDHPRLDDLIAMVEGFNRAVVERVVRCGAEVVTFAEDLGAQTGPLVSPRCFRRYVKPTYARLIAAARREGALAYLHSDGLVMDLVDDLIETGVQVLNPQDLVNGIENLGRHVKGRVAIVLDVDRQRITPFGSPADVEELIREEVMRLSSPQGGLALMYGLYPGTPLENAEAVMTAMEKYAEWKG